jgi:hypothetical protein
MAGPVAGMAGFGRGHGWFRSRAWLASSRAWLVSVAGMARSYGEKAAGFKAGFLAK